MLRHPLHPVLVHAPIACWGLTPVCDALALWLGDPFFFQAAALLAAFGVAGGALAATAGALDFARAQEAAPRVALAHVLLMSAAWALTTAGLLGRIGPDYAAITPAPAWAIACGVIAVAVMLAGAWCGGELVYGKGVGVARR